MKIKMKLLTDTIFGNGASVPGGEDISVLHDKQGFPYYKGSTFKGVFREELERYLLWEKEQADEAAGDDDWARKEAERIANEICGFRGNHDSLKDKAVFSDFQLSEEIRTVILKEIGNHPEEVLETLTHLRTFTAMEKDGSGVVETGSLRTARCVNRGLVLYSQINCSNDKNEKIIRKVLPMIKWIGTMRNRGFGKIRIEVID